MQINKTENVIFLKNVESNIIQEAFVILKDNIKLEKSNSKDNILEKDNKEINILKEAEELINQEISSNNIKYNKYKILKLEKKLKVMKFINIISIVGLILYIIIK
ncbi:MAG: hypothetical protein IKL55_02380 [Clostridia bacterium]|nr:hypothetical protein [Clostridia bacterium]